MTQESRTILRLALTRDEGLRLKPYEDTTGHLTIGVGRNLTDVGISSDEAQMLLDHDIDRVVRMLDERIPWWGQLDPVRQRVLLNMGFNLGYGLFQFRNTLAHVQRGEYTDAAEHMLDSLWSRQVGARALRLANAMRTGVEA